MNKNVKPVNSDNMIQHNLGYTVVYVEGTSVTYLAETEVMNMEGIRSEIIGVTIPHASTIFNNYLDAMLFYKKAMDIINMASFGNGSIRIAVVTIDVDISIPDVGAQLGLGTALNKLSRDDLQSIMDHIRAVEPVKVESVLLSKLTSLETLDALPPGSSVKDYSFLQETYESLIPIDKHQDVFEEEDGLSLVPKQ